MSGWQSAETAPRDGTWFLAYWLLRDHDPDEGFGIIHWNSIARQFVNESDQRADLFDAWQPLPSPPEGQP